MSRRANRPGTVSVTTVDAETIAALPDLLAALQLDLQQLRQQHERDLPAGVSHTIAIACAHMHLVIADVTAIVRRIDEQRPPRKGADRVGPYAGDGTARAA